MTTIDISVGRKIYNVQCEESQVEYIRSIASELNKRVNRMIISCSSDSTIKHDNDFFILLVSLSLIDELTESNENKSNNEELFTQTEVDDFTSGIIYDLSKKLQNIKNKFAIEVNKKDEKNLELF